MNLLTEDAFSHGLNRFHGFFLTDLYRKSVWIREICESFLTEDVSISHGFNGWHGFIIDRICGICEK